MSGAVIILRAPPALTRPTALAVFGALLVVQGGVLPLPPGFEWFAPILFLACSKLVASVQLDATLPPIDALLAAAREWEPVFAGELRIILDYVGDRAPESLREDRAIREVAEGMAASVAAFVGADRAEAVMSAIFGVLLLRWFDGQSTSFSVLEAMLRRLLAGRPLR